MPGNVPSFKLLEINLLSAQDLAPVSKTMRTFAVAWVEKQKKMATRIDQNGTNPNWNEKFVFKVDHDFVDDENSGVQIEIYASAWKRDILVGAVSVPAGSLFPPAFRSQKNPKPRFLALQIRRPSGRTQGVINVGVTLLDGTRRSLPLSDLSASCARFRDHSIASKQKNFPGNKIVLRSKSERSTSEFCYPVKHKESVINGSEIVVAQGKDGKIAMGSLCSDVGPSPSVVAAAIAMGLYPGTSKVEETAESSILNDWTEEDSVEGLRTKIERWRSELHPIHDRNYQNKIYQSTHKPNKPKKREHQRRKSGLFSCFGTAYGCEFSITCGGGNRKKGVDGDKDHLSPSELTYDESYV